MKYIVEQFGDIGGKDEFATYDDAMAHVVSVTTWLGKDWFGEDAPPFCDPEDNRITITEVMDSGHKKVVWHFSGWHWDADEFGIPQGKLPGHEKSLYQESNEH